MPNMDNQTPRNGRRGLKSKRGSYEFEEEEDDDDLSPPSSLGGAPRRSLRKRRSSKSYVSDDDEDFLGDATPVKRMKFDSVFAETRVLCQILLSNLQKHQYAWPFNQPVDPVALNLPDYFQKITRPMDFSTIQKKLDVGSYKTSDEFATDIRLVFSNCLIYNPAESDIATMARSLSSNFELQFQQIKAREAKLADNAELNDMKNIISELRNEHQKLLLELQKLVRKNGGASPVNLPAPTVAALQDTYKRSHMKDKSRRSFKSKGFGRQGNAKKPVVFDYTMKELLSTKINSLCAENLERMVNFLSEYAPSEFAGPSSNGELEIDLEKMSNQTLLALDDFVNNCLKEQTAGTSNGSTTTPRAAVKEESESESDSSDSDSDRDETAAQ